jgi:hydroxyethylthiazole kinase-like uncharacterized protein yjeF
MIPITPELLRQNPLPAPQEGDKDGRGRVLVVGGSLDLPGAALLAATAALRTGAGRLRIATCRSLAATLGLAVPEARVIALEESDAGGLASSNAARLAEAAASMDAVLIGPGMDPADASPLTARLLASLKGPAVLDAGALAALPGLEGELGALAGKLILTPHAGEMAKLLGAERAGIEADPAGAARQAAARFASVVVMKGAKTHVVVPGGGTWLFEGGSVGLATSGSGDALAGIIAGALARGAEPAWAAVWGVFLHGEAGARLMRGGGGIGFLAREISGEVPAIMASVAPGPG